MRLSDRYALGFYALYAWNLRTWGVRDAPGVNVCLVAGFVLTIVTISVFSVVESLVHTGLATVPWLGEIASIVLFLALAILHYVRMVRGKEDQMREAVEQYLERKMHLYAAIAYILSTLGVSFLLGYLSRVIDGIVI